MALRGRIRAAVERQIRIAYRRTALHVAVPILPLHTVRIVGVEPQRVHTLKFNAVGLDLPFRSTGTCKATHQHSHDDQPESPKPPPEENETRHVRARASSAVVRPLRKGGKEGRGTGDRDGRHGSRIDA